MDCLGVNSLLSVQGIDQELKKKTLNIPIQIGECSLFHP